MILRVDARQGEYVRIATLIVIALLIVFNFSEKTQAGPHSPDVCPEGTVLVGGYCIDQYEYPNKKDATPMTGRSWIQAAAKCDAAGKRLCTLSEWTGACGGSANSRYPYGDSYESTYCNDFSVTLMAEKAASGSREKCVTDQGVYDMSANVAEWVYDPYDPQGISGVVGGSSASHSSNEIACVDTYERGMDHDTKNVGFRCCMDMIYCNTDADCDDGINLTIDTCARPGTPESSCMNIEIECNYDVDCDDFERYTQDVCTDAGTLSAACEYNEITCIDETDCDDGEALTLDFCRQAGTPESVCESIAIACNAPGDCYDGDLYTEDVCNRGGTLKASCSNPASACISNADCVDDEALTIDECLEPGLAVAKCVNHKIACLTTSDCDDSNAYTLDTCVDGGSKTAECTNEPIACLSNADCEDDDRYTADNCRNAGQPSAFCEHDAIACFSDAQCEDNLALTIDTCAAPGTADSKCDHLRVECIADADCDDMDEYTVDTCASPYTPEARCGHAPVACVRDEDCNDSNSDTVDRCTNPASVFASCSNKVIPPIVVSVPAEEVVAPAEEPQPVLEPEVEITYEPTPEEPARPAVTPEPPSVFVEPEEPDVEITFEPEPTEPEPAEPSIPEIAAVPPVQPVQPVQPPREVKNEFTLETPPMMTGADGTLPLDDRFIAKFQDTDWPETPGAMEPERPPMPVEVADEEEPVVWNREFGFSNNSLLSPLTRYQLSSAPEGAYLSLEYFDLGNIVNSPGQGSKYVMSVNGIGATTGYNFGRGRLDYTRLQYKADSTVDGVDDSTKHGIDIYHASYVLTVVNDFDAWSGDVSVGMRWFENTIGPVTEVYLAREFLNERWMIMSAVNFMDWSVADDRIGFSLDVRYHMMPRWSLFGHYGTAELFKSIANHHILPDTSVNGLISCDDCDNSSGSAGVSYKMGNGRGDVYLFIYDIGDLVVPMGGTTISF